MSANGESLGRVLGVALGLCLVCSMVVSTAAVLLKPAQQANKTLDLKRNILMAAGLLDPALSVEEQFEQVETRVVDLDQGRFVGDVDPVAFDQREAAKDPAQSRAIPGDEDPAKLVRREDHALVYLVRDDSGELNKDYFAHQGLRVVVYTVRIYGTGVRWQHGCWIGILRARRNTGAGR